MTDPSSTPPRALREAIWRRARTGPLVCALVATAFILDGLTRPNALFGVVQYDDGVYFDAAVRLVSGSIPYRDFVMVQPPGVAVLFAPIALLARHIGTRDGLAIARCVTALVCGANVYLAGRLLAHRGRVAATIASVIVALFPAAVFADRTLLLEPYVVLFSLLGARRCFRDGEVAGARNLFIAGLWFGVALSTKLWAAVLLAALVATVMTPKRDRAQDLVQRLRASSFLLGGVLVAVAIICVPFLAVAPSAFVHDVVSAQLDRHAGSTAAIWLRLSDIVGIDGTGTAVSEPLAYVIGAVLAAVMIVGGVMPMLRRQLRGIECFLLLSTTGGVLAILVPSQYYNHYAYFVAPFLAGSLVLSSSRCIAWLSSRTSQSPMRPRALFIAGGCVLFAAAATLAVAETRFDYSLLQSTGDPALAIDLAIPAGGCAISDATILLIEANRAIPTSPTCPSLVDATGLWLATAPTEPPLGCEQISPRLVATWQNLLSRSDFFVESGSAVSRVPWTVGLRSWFKSSYRHIPDPGAQVFVRLGSHYAKAALDPTRWTISRLLAEGWRPVHHHGKGRVVHLPACLATRH